jgi:mannose-6-phosphate isomerase-like protein (cupin superfamily)
MTETLTSGLITLDRSRIVLLTADLGLRPLGVDASFWATMSEQPELVDGRVLSVFDYQGDWTWWERHPLGEELVYVLSGEVEFLLDDEDRQWSVELSPGTAAIVPRDTWHSARVPKPSTVLFVTPTPARTEHRNST